MGSERTDERAGLALTHSLEAPHVCVRAIEEALQALLVSVHDGGSACLVDPCVGFFIVVEARLLSDGRARVASEGQWGRAREG
jgi:hypothetical protein